MDEVNYFYIRETLQKLKRERILETLGKQSNTQWDHHQRTKKLIQDFSSKKKNANKNHHQRFELLILLEDAKA